MSVPEEQKYAEHELGKDKRECPMTSEERKLLSLSA